MSSKEPRKIRILVSGSARADQPDFVRGLLNGFDEVFDIGCVISGPFSGADSFAKEWAASRKVRYERLDIQNTGAEGDLTSLSFFDSHRRIPNVVLRADPRFSKAFSAIKTAAPDVVLAIPAPDGLLGPATACLVRIAESQGVQVINGAEAFQAVEAQLRDGVAACQPPEPAAASKSKVTAPA